MKNYKISGKMLLLPIYGVIITVASIIIGVINFYARMPKADIGDPEAGAYMAIMQNTLLTGLAIMPVAIIAFIIIVISGWNYLTNLSELELDSNFIHYENTSINLKQISSVEVEQGIFGLFSNYGDVVITPSNNAGQIKSKFRQNPSKVKADIMAEMSKA